MIFKMLSMYSKVWAGSRCWPRQGVAFRPSAIAGLLALLTALGNAQALADEVTIVADRWYPYNGKPGSRNPGLMIEIARYGLAKSGHSLKYQILGWERALSEVRQGNKNCVVGAYRSDAPDFVFPDLHQSVDHLLFFTRAGDPWSFSGIESLKHLRFAIMPGYFYSDAINRYIDENTGSERLVLGKGLFGMELNLMRLVNGDADVMIGSRAVVNNIAADKNWSKKIGVAGEVDKPTRIYVACSPALESSRYYVNLISAGTWELHRSGQLQALNRKYGVENWMEIDAVDN